MDINTVIAQLATLMIILAAGYVCNKIKLFNEESNRFISKLVINLTMPCTTLGAVIGGVEATSGDTVFFLLMSVSALVFFFVIALPFSFSLRAIRADRGVYAYMITFINASFMGFPVALSIFGEASAFFVALFNIPFTILNFSVGILMISGGRGKTNLRALINPSLVSGLLTLILFFLGLKLPAVVTSSIKLVGGMTTPCAMLVIGSTMAGVPFRDVFSEWRIYPTALVRLIVTPLLTWLVFRNFISNELMLGVLVVISGMPVAASGTMFATKYGGNEHLVSNGIFLTTLLSAVSIPTIVFLLFT